MKTKTLPACVHYLSEPVLDFTLEEEFRLYELEAMKENLFNGCFKIFLGFPNCLENISKALTSLNQGESCGFSRERVLSKCNTSADSGTHFPR